MDKVIARALGNLVRGNIDIPTFFKAMDQYSEKVSSKLAEEDGLEKGGKGEGSRGGHIIGHTRSGKPIYGSFEHGGHKHFTSEDHHDASRLHSHNLDIYSKFTKHPTNYDVKQAVHHSTESKKHFDASLTHGPASKETYDRHMDHYARLNDSERKKYRDQVKTTHAIGNALNEADRFKNSDPQWETNKQRHAAHKKFLDDTKDM